MPRLNRPICVLLILSLVFAVAFLATSPVGSDLRVILPTGVKRPVSEEHYGAEAAAGIIPGGGPPQAIVDGKPAEESHRHPLKTMTDNYLVPDIEYDQRGIMTYDPKQHKKHPIELLIERGKRLVTAIDRRVKSITTLEAAVTDYKEAYGMAPPRGFDNW